MFFNKSIILFICISFNFLKAQPVGNFKNINSDEGLPSSECYHIKQDTKGYIWICTNKGVVRYTGKDMRLFTSAHGLKDNVVFSTYEDMEGRIWFRTSNGNLSYCFNDTIYEIAANPKITKILNKRIISKLYVDEKDNLWLTIYGTTNIIIIPKADNYKEPKLIERNKNELYFEINNSSEGLFSATNDIGLQKKILHIKNRKGSKELNLDHAPFRLFSNMVLINDSVFVVSTAGDQVILIKGNETMNIFFKNRVIDVFKVNEHQYWVSVYKEGIYKYDVTNTEKPVSHLFNGYTITSVLKDFEGGMWFSTLENGVYYKRSLDNHAYEFEGKETSTSIRFIKIENDKLLLGTDKPGLIAIDANLISTKVELGKSQPGYFINDINYYASTYFLAGYGGLKYFDANLKYKKEIPHIKDTKMPLPSSGINATFKQVKFIDKNKFILNDGYSISLVEDLNVTIKFTLPVKVISFSYDSTHQVIHVATKKGLYKIVSFDTLFAAGDLVLKEASIVKVLKYQPQKHLIATEQNGLYIESENKYRQIFYDKDLLINDIGIDTENNIWVATNRGLVYLQRTNNSFIATYIDKSDGLQSNEVNHVLCFKNLIWHTTRSGLYYFEPAKLIGTQVLPKIEIEEIKINNIITNKRMLNALKYNENNLTVSAKCLSYLPGSSARLSYRLLGYDTVWRSTGRENIIDYTNLPSGNYQLQIKGMNIKGLLSSDTKVIDLNIMKPLWLAWWFILLEVLITVTIIILIVRIYVLTIRNKEKKKTEINKMLADYQMTALRSQINPHFIFNCISSIQALMLKEQIETAYEYLQKFSKLLRVVLENSNKNITTLSEELQVINLYIQLEQLRFDGSFNYIEYIDPKIEITNVKIPYMLLQPIIENAIWHGLLHSDKKEKELVLKINSLKDKITIEIKDNGIGREKSKLYNEGGQKTSLGQNITSERLNIMNSGNGQTTLFEVVDLYDKNIAVGTTVKIELPAN